MNFQEWDHSIYYCMYILDRYSNNLIFMALQTMEKYVKEKWNKLIDDYDKIMIRDFLVKNLSQRLNFLKDKHSEKTRNNFANIINKLNSIIITLAQKEWSKTWKNLISDLCEMAKNDMSYICENNMKILIELSYEINKVAKENMIFRDVEKLNNQMFGELSKIFDLCEFILIYKSSALISCLKINENENINLTDENKLIINILRQAVKLFGEYIEWFNIENIFNKNIIDKLLYILKNCTFCQVEVIGCFENLFELEIDDIKNNNEKLKESIFLIYSSFIDVIHNKIVKKKNFSEEYKLILRNSPEKITGFEDMTLHFENCLINFFKTNFNYIKLKDRDITYHNNINNFCKNSAKDFFNKYINSIMIGLKYLIQITYIKSDQIFNNITEFWYWFVYNLFTLKSNKNNKKDIYNELDNDSVENKDVLIEYLHKSFLYSRYLTLITDKVREILCQNMTKPLEITIELDENGDITTEQNNDTINTIIHENMKNTLIYLSLIDPIKTKNILSDKVTEENKYSSNYSKINTKKLCPICWSIGSISGTMNEKDEHDFLIYVYKVIFCILDNVKGKENRAIGSYNLMYIISQYPFFLHKHYDFLVIVIKKLFEFITDNMEYVKNFGCETFLKISIKCGEDLISKKAENNNVPFINYLLENFNKVIKNLGKHQILMIYESIANIIEKETDIKLKEYYFSELMKSQNEIYEQIINNTKFNINYLNDINITKKIRFFIHINERVCFVLKKFYWVYGSIIFNNIINFFIHYNSQINNINDDKTKFYILLNRSILKYFVSLVKNINDYEIIQKNMILINFGFGELINKFNQNPNNNKDANMLLLFSTIIEIFKNKNHEINNIIWEQFGENIFNLIKYNNNLFPDLKQNYFILIKNLIKYDVECFYIKYNSIPNILIEILLYGASDSNPSISETSLESIIILFQNIIKINTNNEADKKMIIEQFFINYYFPIFDNIFSITLDGFHKRDLINQIKIIQFLVKLLDEEKLCQGNENEKTKLLFKDKLVKYLTSISSNISLKQIETFYYALFNNCNDEHNLKIAFKDLFTSLKIFYKDNDNILEEENIHQINIAIEKRMKREKEQYLPKPQYEMNISINDYFITDSLN